jgi:hypothetical protein
VSVAWIELNGIVPSEFSKGLLRALHSIGISNPVLHGGALRDMYLGRQNEISDYDVHGSIADLIEDTADDPRHIAEKVRATIEYGLPKAYGFDGLTVNRCTLTGAIFVGVDFVLDGKLISLGTDSRNDSFPTIALYADAPLNAIGMNAEGRIIAHPLFEVHVRERLFSPFSGIDSATLSRRFAKMSAKLPGLTMSAAIERSVPPPGPVYC